MTEAAKQWWPFAYVEDTAPDSRATPGDWIVADDAGYALASQEILPPTRRLADGDIVNFISLQEFPDFQMLVMRDGSYEPLTPIPVGATLFAKDDDRLLEDAQYESLQELAHDFSSDLSEAEEITVECCAWSHEIAYRFTVTDGTASFVAVAADVAQVATTISPPPAHGTR